jgi:hypothetical protein
MSEREQLPDHISIAGQAEAAGRVRANLDPIASLKEHALMVIDDANLTSHARMMALPKLEELIFWIKSGMNRGLG